MFHLRGSCDALPIFYYYTIKPGIELLLKELDIINGIVRARGTADEFVGTTCSIADHDECIGTTNLVEKLIS